MPTEGPSLDDRGLATLSRTSRIDQFLAGGGPPTSPTIRGSSGGSGGGSNGNARTPSSSSSGYESQLAFQHHMMASGGGPPPQHHGRESSAFVPVLPSRALRPGLYPGVLEGPPDGLSKDGHVPKRGSSYELMAMMADKRKELALREAAAAAMLLPRPGGPPVQSPSGIYPPPGAFLGGPGPSPTSAGTFTFPPAGVGLLAAVNMPTEGPSLDDRGLATLSRTSRIDQFLAGGGPPTSPTIRGSSGGSGGGSNGNARTPSSSSSGYESQLAFQHHMMASGGGPPPQHHGRESSAFVPVLPSRALRPGLYPGVLEGPPDGLSKDGHVPKRGSSYELMAMMADKRKELALREAAAAAMLLPRPGGPPVQSPSGIYPPPGAFLGGPGPSPTSAGTFTFPPAGVG
uniref:Uncharacterized protein n=1 Tax=Anopheles dirus TaxID=7168 RepID=A0A182NFE5_9DIPT